MSESSEEDHSIEIPYSSRPEWADIQPIDHDEETNDIVRIAYTETFKEVYGYLRAVLKRNEISERAFELTKDAALLNPANYTVWYYRRILLKELKKDLNEELEFITDVIYGNPKNYQVWQHRRCIVELLNDSTQELLFTRQILKKDSKNYHAWQYRQWVVKQFGLWSTELDYINELLDADQRNNSAWNQRYFFFNKQHDLNDKSSLKLIESELEFCLQKLNNCADNESVWNYMNAFLNHLNGLSDVSSEYPQKIKEFCVANMNSTRDGEISPFTLSYLVESNIRQIECLAKATGNDVDEAARKSQIDNLLKCSCEILESLAEKYDKIRANYWKFLIKKYNDAYGRYVQ